MIITDAHVSPTIAAAIEELGIDLVIAGDTMASAML